MKQLFARLWAIYTKNTAVRHAATALVATIVVESAPALTGWALASDQLVVKVILVAAISAAVRWAQRKLEPPAPTGPEPLPVSAPELTTQPA